MFFAAAFSFRVIDFSMKGYKELMEGEMSHMSVQII